MDLIISCFRNLHFSLFLPKSKSCLNAALQEYSYEHLLYGAVNIMIVRHMHMIQVTVFLQDGVVLGADTRATSGEVVADKMCAKIHYISPNI